MEFNNATQYQIKELFERMYANDLPRTRLQPSSPQPSPSPVVTSNGKSPISINTRKELTPPATPTSNEHSTLQATKEKSDTSSNGNLLNAVVEEVQGEELSILAGRFAEKIPDGLFSPAELQGFLLKRKKDPRKACEEVENWVTGMLEVKRVGGKLVPQ